MTHRLSADSLIEKATATRGASPHLRQRFLATDTAASEQMCERLQRTGNAESVFVSLCLFFITEKRGRVALSSRSSQPMTAVWLALKCKEH